MPQPRRKKVHNIRVDFGGYGDYPVSVRLAKKKLFAKTIFKAGFLLLFFAATLLGIWNINKTISSLSDVEISQNNAFYAGILDFELSSAQVFSDIILSPGDFATGAVSVVNLDNIPKYKLRAADFTGGLCNYLNLEANLDGGDAEYSGKLTEMDFGPVVFESPDDWDFVLSLPADVPQAVIGETCNFNFIFYGSQTRNDLPFGAGFSDTEDTKGNVLAKMCFDSETRSCGYWKNHSEIYRPYLPQKLGDEIIDTAIKADRVLKSACGNCTCGFDCDKTMRGKLKGQLLAMKFNVAHFGMGEYVPAGTTSSVNQIIAQADELLKQEPALDDSVLEQMKNILEALAQDLQIKVCTETGVNVVIPNGGEQWWVGKYYDLMWLTKNMSCPGDLVHINIWYSGDSGTTWGNIALGTEDDGIYNWRIPLFLTDGYYTVSDRARIKIVAACSENLMVQGWDISDYDFCPPIDPSLLTPEELEMAISLGLIEPPAEIEIPEEEIAGASTTTEEATTTYIIDLGSMPVIPETPQDDGAAFATGTAITEDATTTDATTTDDIPDNADPVIPSEPSPVPFCGDGMMNGDDECDGTDGTAEHYICDSFCALQYVPYCGDGNLDGGEECDMGGQNGIECIFEPDSSCTYCSADCKNVTPTE